VKTDTYIREQPDKHGRDLMKLIFIILFFLIMFLFIMDIVLGSVSFKLTDIIHAIFSSSDKGLETIIFRFRIPKAITALLVGIALSLSGLQMQTVFRNPMAGPYVLGISSGASLGVAFVILGFSAQMSPGSIHGLGNWALVAASWLGAGRL
jgi:iron complex transport system permease protein